MSESSTSTPEGDKMQVDHGTDDLGLCLTQRVPHPSTSLASIMMAPSSRHDNGQVNQELSRGGLLTSDEVQTGTSTQDGLQTIPTNKPSFSIQPHLIQGVPLSQQASELQSLGLDVYNQDQFEQDVMAQYDEAIASAERERVKQILLKELKTVQDDIRSVKGEINHIDKVLTMVTPDPKGPKNREAIRKMESVKRQRENKLKQLKKLRAKEKSLTIKVDGNMSALDNDEALIQGPQQPSILEQTLLGVDVQETEHERLIRTGEMTPFGTVVKSQQKEPSAPTPSTSATMTDFEMFLMEKDNKKPQKQKAHKTPEKKSEVKKKSKSSTSSDSSRRGSIISEESSSGSTPKHDKKGSNFFDNRDNKLYYGEKDFSNYKSWKRNFKVKHNFSGDGRRSDEDSFSDDDGGEDEYLPNDREFQNSWKDESDSGDSGQKADAKKRKNQSKSLTNKKVKAENDDDGGTSISDIKKNCKKGTRVRDDGNIVAYRSRIKKWHKENLKVKHAHLLTGDDTDDVDDGDEDVDSDAGYKVPSRIWNKLYTYQKTCVKWLWELHSQQCGGIVGDEMGLGKTIQMIAFLVGLKHSQLPNNGFRHRGLGPVLIVCPATVMHQWVKECYTWWPPFRVAVLHSSGSYTGSEHNLVYNIVQTPGILITSYSTLVLRQDILLKYSWHYVILDEGHKIRNPDAQSTLACKMFRTPHRIILSGSPLQNNLKELWSLFDFIFPGKLGTLPDFMQHFSVPITQGGYSNASDVQVQTSYKCAMVLRDTINPYLLRRMKADVLSNIALPDKNEQVLFCHLTDEQREVYSEYLDSRECQQILNGGYMVFPGLITLRKICNHPDLSTGGPKYFDSDRYDAENEDNRFGAWRRSGKMVVVESLLKIWKSQGHRVLLFTQSKQMLDILEGFIQQKCYRYLRMDGTTTISSRQPLINHFNEDQGIFIFILTTKVGGLGVNLTGANRVIIFDPDWNPSTDLQARERAWRIGQKKQVTIYRLLMTGTIEEKIYHRQIFKQFLTNRVLKDPKQRRFFKSNDLFELFTLGSVDKKQITETSAIFAGTGSDVRVNLKNANKKPNRFDLMKEQELKSKKSARTELDSDEEIESAETKSKPEERKAKEGKDNTEDDRVARMKELAKRLSSMIGKGEVKNGTKESKTCDSSKQKKSSQKKSRKGKEKKKKYAEFEGHMIKNLAKHETHADKQESNAQLDDYVLHRLMKKTGGVHSAIKHDVIMGSSNPDYALVEMEADRVAKNAAKALKESRSRCKSTAIGVPTWTGSSGYGGAPGSIKPRFGAKKVRASPSEQLKQAVSPIPKTKKLFNGAVSGLASTSNTTTEVSSNSLLNNMRKRNYGRKPTDSDSGDDDQPVPPDEIVKDDDELIRDIQTFIAFRGSIMDGQATTDDILWEFKSRLPKNDSAKFKSMLNQICTFEKNETIGLWTLKPEFR